MDNTHIYGFRWHSAVYGYAPPPIIECSVASGQDDQDTSTNSIDLNVGDPVKLVTTGGVTIAQGGDAVYGIIMGIKQYWDGTKMVIGNKLPNQTTWGTVEERRSIVLVTPASAGIWEVDCDDKVTYTTRALYQAAMNGNVVHTTPGNTSDTSADPYIDISDVATDETYEWRLVGISPTAANRDFSGSYVKVLVRVNESEEAGAAAAKNPGVI
jgi:hypothetical protein